MHSIYVVAPDVDSSTRRTAPGDGQVEWLRAVPPLDNFTTLAEVLAKLALARGPVNVLRFFAHGQSGIIYPFGTTSRATLSFTAPSEEAEKAVRKLQGIFDRRPGRRRELFLHSCYAASDRPGQCTRIPGTDGGQRCNILGYIAPAAKEGGFDAPGYLLLQGLANLTNVPVIGTSDLIYYNRIPYDWTFPGRVLYVYPGGGTVTFPGILFEGAYFGKLPPGSASKIEQFKQTTLDIPVFSSEDIKHPAADRHFGPKWHSWCSGMLNIRGSLNDWHLSSRFSVSGEEGLFAIDCAGVGKGSAIASAPIPFDYTVAKGTGVFLGGHGQGEGKLFVDHNGEDFTLQFASKRDG